METRRQKRLRRSESGRSESSDSEQSPPPAQPHPPPRSSGKIAERQLSPPPGVKKPKREDLDQTAYPPQPLHASFDLFQPDPTPFLREHYAGRSQPSSHHQAQLAALRSHDPGEVLQTLSQLHQQLVLAQDDTFSSFPVEQYLPVLVDALSQCTDAETGVLAVKSLSQILDAVPNAAHLLAVCGGVAVLCSRLSNFEYIDTAESVIKCLEKVVHEQAGEVMKEGAMLALLNVVEVLEAPSQKLVFATVCGLMKAVNSFDSFSQWVAPGLPLLSALLKYQTPEFAQLNEMALDCFLSLILSLERMEQSQARACAECLSSVELLASLQRLAESLPRLSSGVLRLLRSLFRLSFTSLRAFLSLDAARFISSFLDGEEQLMQDALALAASLLPGPHDREAAELYHDRPDLLKQLGAIVLPKVLRAYDSTSSRVLKRVSLEVADKLLARSSPQLLKSLMNARDVARFIRELLDSREVSVVKTALKLTFELQEKMQEEVRVWLVREGVLAKVSQLTSEPGTTDLFESESRSLHRRNVRGYLPGRSDPHSMEQLIAQIRQRAQRTGVRATFRAEDFMRTRGFDTVQESRAEFQRLASKVAEKCKATDCAGEVVIRLKAVRDSFLKGEDAVAELLAVLTSADDATSFEICASEVLDALWQWLLGDHAQSRLYRLLTTLLQEGKDGELLMATLVRKLVSVLRFAHSFPVVQQEVAQLGGHSSLRALTQRIQVTLSYQPALNPALDAGEIAEREEVFARCSGLSVYLELYQTLDSVREALSKVKSAEDLARFGASFQRSISEVRALMRDRPSYRFARSEDLLEDLDPREMLERMQRLEEMEDDDSELMEEEEALLVRPAERKDSLLSVALHARLFFDGVEVAPGTTLFELSNRSNADIVEGLVVHFAYFHTDPAPLSLSAYLRGGPALLKNLFEETKSVGVNAGTGAYVPLRVLKLLNACNRHMTSLLSPSSLLFPDCRTSLVHAMVPPQTFYSQQMTALLGKQLQDITAMTGGVMSDWVKELPRQSWFLFPFTVRAQLLRSWALGPLKSLAYFAQKLKNTQDSFQVRVPRHKVSIQRERLLESAQRVMKDRSLIQTGLLEFDFQGEEGTGKGPTLEFYSLVSRSIRLLPVWRNSGEETGLFPSPTLTDNAEEVFEFVGRLVGKALIDERLLDLPLSPSFWKLVFRLPLVLTDVLNVDPQLGASLLELQSLLNRKLAGSADTTLRGTEVSDLSLTFTLPGYEDFELKPQGRTTVVTLDSLEEYIHLVATASLMQTSASEAFRKGLEVLVSVERLRMFTGEELECLLCGEQDEDWRIETLSATVVAAHGYSKSSTTFQQVLLVMSQFTSDERKLFLQFITGTPRLPLGGFAGLSPPLTVVRRDTEGSGNVDDYLPSVMTCQNYLKVPLYSSFEVLRRQLLYACSEGHESFNLS